MNTMFGLKIVLVFSLSLIAWARTSCAYNVSYDSRGLIINGQRKIIISGAIHYPRSSVAMWPDLMRKAKDGGLDAIETYAFWDRHEPQPRVYDFSGNHDIVGFLKEAQKAGLYVILRIGPYVCAEWTYGAFPMWLHNIPGIQLRTNNEIYKREMQTFTTKIVTMMKQANMFGPQGGPIILAQIENEYGNVMWQYGDDGKAYINWCAQMAVAQNIGVPWIMCQQSNAPSPIINTCNGYYCDQFTPNNPNSPKIWTENWIGWYKTWGSADPYRTAQDGAFSVARFFQNGGIMSNYYMYHGGTNLGRTGGGPYITTSYDYDAPISEYGVVNQPKWGHLKELHLALKVGEAILTSGSPPNTRNIANGSVQLTTYTQNGARFCFLSNTDTSNDANVDLQADGIYSVPAWSVSILQDCNKEIHNTAKVKFQGTSTANFTYTNHNSTIHWSWLTIPVADQRSAGKLPTEKVLVDQKDVTVDASDHLWYLTAFSIDNLDAWKTNTSIQVQTSGHVLHAFVNGKLMGSQWGTVSNFSFQFQKPVTNLVLGVNHLALLSVTVGFQNYGPNFDITPTGLVNGSVVLRGTGGAILDLTNNEWAYKVGVYEDAKAKGQWVTKGSLPKGQPLTMYSGDFVPPNGMEPVVVKLSGMTKGEAWVNGHHIGRYWPGFIANDNCTNTNTNTCDYRGSYNAEKCVTNCGNPTQSYYHVPRSFFTLQNNTLTLFEEIGGDPSAVSFYTVSNGTKSQQ